MTSNTRTWYFILVIRMPSSVSVLKSIQFFSALLKPSLLETLSSHSSKYGKKVSSNHYKVIVWTQLNKGVMSYHVHVQLFLHWHAFSLVSSAWWYGCWKGFRYRVPLVKFVTFSTSKKSNIEVNLAVWDDLSPTTGGRALETESLRTCPNIEIHVAHL